MSVSLVAFVLYLLVVWGIGLLAGLLAIGLGLVELRHRSGTERAAEAFASYRPPRMGDFGETRSLRITPLVDYHTARPELVGEVGLSYLVETDERRILFDVAYNAKRESPSPLERNMRTLGIELATSPDDDSSPPQASRTGASQSAE